MTTYPALSMIIAGERVSGGGRRTHRVVNPATGETLGEKAQRRLELGAVGRRRWHTRQPSLWGRRSKLGSGGNAEARSFMHCHRNATVTVMLE